MNFIRMHSIKHLIFLLLCLVPISLPAQTMSLDEFFVDGISSQIQIGKELRSSLISQYKSGNGGELTMRNGNVVRILEYKENDYMTLQTSEKGFFSLKRWVRGNRTIFGLSWWVSTPVRDGHVKFVDLSTLDNVVKFPVVGVKDFLSDDSLSAQQTTADEFCQQLEAQFLHCEFTESDTIWVYDDTREFLDLLRRRTYGRFWKGNALPVLFGKDDFIKGEAVFRKKQ